MTKTTLSGLAMSLLLVGALYAPPSRSAQCGVKAVSLKSNDSVQYVIAECPSEPTETDFKIVDSGAESIARIALTSNGGVEGIFTITGVAPGKTAFRIEHKSKSGRIKFGICNVNVAVVDE